MLEHFAEVIYSSLLASRSVAGHCVSVYSATGIIVRSMSQDILDIFPLHQNSRGKGKGRADLPHHDLVRTRVRRKEKQGYVQLQRGFCHTTSLQLSIRKSLLRQRRAVCHSCLRPFSRNTAYRISPSFLMFIRSVSSSASIPKRQMYPVSARAISKEQGVVSGRSKTPSTNLKTQFDWEKILERYWSIEQGGGQDDLDAFELLGLAHRIAKDHSIMTGSSNDDIRSSIQAGNRLADVLDAFASQKPLQYLHDHQWSCLKAASLALCGDHKSAQQYLPDLIAILNRPHPSVYAILAYRHICLSIWRHSSHLDALIYYSNNRPYQIFENDIASNADRLRLKSPILATLAEIVLSIPSPVNLLSFLKYSHPADQIRSIAIIMVRVLLGNNLIKDAYAVYDEMEKQGLVLPAYFYMELVRSLAKEGKHYSANLLFSAIVPNSGIAQHYHVTGLYLHAHQGQFVQAEKHFTQLLSMKKATSSDVNLLMLSYALTGRTKKVVDIFNQHLTTSCMERNPTQPIGAANIYHYSEIIFAHAQAADYGGMNSWLEVMGREGVTPDLHVYNMILKSLVTRGDLEAAATLLDQMREANIHPDIVSYTTVISLLANRRDPIGAEALYKRAIQEGISPDVKMISAVMHAHVEAGSWQGVVRAFDYLQLTPSHNVRLDITVYNILIKAYVLSGTPFSVLAKLYRRMDDHQLRPNGRTFALLIQSACDSGDMSAATRLLSEMDRASKYWQNNLEINVYVLTIIMSGFLRLGYREQAKGVYDEMLRRGIQPSGHTYATILRSYATDDRGSIQIAEDFLKSIIKPGKDERAWDQPIGEHIPSIEYAFMPLMDYFSKRLQPKEVERLIQDLENIGREPSLGTLSILLDAYRRTSNIEAVLNLWPQVFELGMKVSNVQALFKSGELVISRRGPLLSIPLSIYIDALSSAGYHLKVAEVWGTLNSKGFYFDSHNWNHLVVALIRAGEPEHAFEVLEKVILKYQDESESILTTRMRSRTPSSPLFFSDHVAGDDDSSLAPPSESDYVGRRLRSRPFAVKEFTKSVAGLTLDNGDMDDFVHPLHILHQITPMWNSWRPHDLTLSVLSQVLQRLEIGGLIPATKADSEKSTESEEIRIQEDRRNELAAGILRRIYSKYPKAVIAVRRWRFKRAV